MALRRKFDLVIQEFCLLVFGRLSSFLVYPELLCRDFAGRQDRLLVLNPRLILVLPKSAILVDRSGLFTPFLLRREISFDFFFSLSTFVYLYTAMDLTITACTVVITVPPDGNPLTLDEVRTYLTAMTEYHGSPHRPLYEFVRAYQLLPDQYSVRLSFRTKEDVSLALEFSECLSPNHPFRMSPARFRRKVILRFLPVELAATAVCSSLSKFGSVVSHRMCTTNGVLIGTREVVIDLREHIPSKIFISGHSAVTYYADQQRTCFKCGATTHEIKLCPASPQSKAIVSDDPPTPSPIIEQSSLQKLSESIQHTNADQPNINTSTSIVSSTNTVCSKPLIVAPPEFSPPDVSLKLSSSEPAQVPPANLADSSSKSVEQSCSPSSSSNACSSQSSESPDLTQTVCTAELTTVTISFLPIELSPRVVRDAFLSYGIVWSHTMCKQQRIQTGSRELVIRLERHIPSKIFILGHECGVSYDSQPQNTVWVVPVDAKLKD